MTKLIIIGAGGHGRVVADCAQSAKKYQEIVFLDDSFDNRKNNLIWPIIGLSSSWQQYINNAQFIVALGNNKIRLQISHEIEEAGGKLATIIHPSAVISEQCHIDSGTVIFANSVVNVATSISKACIINTGATIDHDCQIGNAVHISPGANIAGTVTIGQLSWVGVGASIIQGINLADNTQVGAGAAVISSTEANSLYVGVPAKRIKSIN